MAGAGGGGGIDSTALMTRLSARIEDDSNQSFSTSQLSTILDESAEWILSMLDIVYLSDFMDEVSSSLSNGSVSFTNLGITTDTVIVAVQHNQVGEEPYFFDMMTYPEYVTKRGNEYFVGDPDHPILYTHLDKLYSDPIKTASIKVKYLITPSGLGTGATNLVFPIKLEELLLDYAESKVWRMDNKNDRSAIALKSAMDQVQILNQKVGRA